MATKICPRCGATYDISVMVCPICGLDFLSEEKEEKEKERREKEKEKREKKKKKREELAKTWKKQIKHIILGYIILCIILVSLSLINSLMLSNDQTVQQRVKFIGDCSSYYFIRYSLVPGRISQISPGFETLADRVNYLGQRINDKFTQNGSTDQIIPNR